MDVGETVIPTGVTVGEPLVIKTHQMEDRGVEVMGVDRLHDRAQAVFVGLAMDDPPLGAAAGQPRRECPRVVLAARGIGGVVEGGAAELGRPDDERLVEHPPRLEIGKQGPDRLIDVLRQADVRHHVAVGVPVVARAGVDELHEPHTTLDESAGSKALPAEAGRLPGLEAVGGERADRFP